MSINRKNIQKTSFFIQEIFEKIDSLRGEKLREGFLKDKTRVYKDEENAKIGEIADKLEKKEYKNGDEEDMGVSGKKVISELLKRQIEDKFEEI